MKPLPFCSSLTELQFPSELLPISGSTPVTMPTILKSATNLQVPQCEAQNLQMQTFLMPKPLGGSRRG